MFIWYRNSFLASLVSIAGCCAAMVALSLLFSGAAPTGILCAGVAAGLLFGGKKISEKKSFDKWWKQVENAQLEPEIRCSRETAVEIYRKNPEKRTLAKIRRLNPAAAAYIENGFRERAEQAPSTAAVSGRIAESFRKPESGTLQVGEKEQTQKENKKIKLLALACLVLLALLISMIYQDAREKTVADPVTPAQSQSQSQILPQREKVPIQYGETPERFEHESGYTFATTFSEPIRDCSEFTLEYELYVLEGEEAPEDDVLCDVYVRAVEGDWELAASFRMDGTLASHRIYLDRLMDLESVAVVYHAQLHAYDIRVYDPA